MSYLLFVRSSEDLERACREVSEYFAFRQRQSGVASHTVLGVWIDASTVSRIPLALVPPAWPSSDHGFPIRERFGVSGIWELARIELPPHALESRGSPDPVIDSLRGIPGAEDGLFAPVFTRALRPSAMDRALRRLRCRYPNSLAPPVVQNPDSGSLDCCYEGA